MIQNFSMHLENLPCTLYFRFLVPIDRQCLHCIQYNTIKLTALLNLSEEKYEGGELFLFRANELICNEFNTPGSAIIFPSFINHKVNKILSGRRHTLAIWFSGPKFR